MTDWLLQFFKDEYHALLTSGIFSLGLYFLLRRLIATRLDEAVKHEYGVKLVEIKSELQRENDKALANLQAEHEKSKQLLEHNLEIARLEYQIKYAGINQKIIEAIEDVYPTLLNMQAIMQAYTNLLQDGSIENPHEKHRENLNAELKTFWLVFNKKRVFFTKQLDEKIVDYVNKIKSEAIDFLWRVEKSPSESINKLKSWNTINKNVTALWDSTVCSIAEEFRNRIGVYPPSDEDNAMGVIDGEPNG